jgi:hypothetical protein
MTSGLHAHAMHHIGTHSIHVVLDKTIRTLCGLDASEMRHFPHPWTTCAKCHDEAAKLLGGRDPHQTVPTPDVALATTWEPAHVEPPGRRVVKPRKTPRTEGPADG